MSAKPGVGIRPAVERFWEKVDKTAGCWLWTGCRTAPGWHGRFTSDGRRIDSDGSRRHPTHVMAHRFSWELHYGPIPAGLNVCHSCDEPACVRPDHLFVGTQRANMLDAGRKGHMGQGNKHKVVCVNGHPFTEANTYRSPKTGRRQCHICRQAAERRRQAKRRVLSAA